MKLLIAIPSPRDITIVQEAMRRINFIDKFYVKYTKEYEAYLQIQEFFLSHDYTHLILWADDLLVQPVDFYQLIADLRFKNYQVIGGICQVDNDHFKDDMAISLTPFQPKIYDRFRYFEKFDKYYFRDKLREEYQSRPIIRTFWQGFPLTCIHRDVFDELDFRDDGEFKGIPRGSGCCMDDAFCWDCIQNEIPMYTDLRIRMNHLKFNDVNTYQHLVRNKKPYTEFIKKES